jgi:hypothetical protein
VISRSKDQVLPSSGPLITSRTYIPDAFARAGRAVLSPSGCGMAKPDEQDLLDIEPEALRQAEFLQAQELLSAMVGKRVSAAHVEDTRIALRMEDGMMYYFYGFMGGETPEDAAE